MLDLLGLGQLLITITNKQLLLILMGVLIAFLVLVVVLSIIFITALKKRAPVVKVVMAPPKDGEQQPEQLTAEQEEAYKKAAEEEAERKAAEEELARIAEEQKRLEEEAARLAAEEEARRAAEEEAARLAAEEEARKAAEEEAARLAAEEEARRAAEEEAARLAAEEEARRAAEEEEARLAAEEVLEEEPEEEEPEEDEEDEEPLTEEEEELAATQELDVSEMSEATREALGITEEDAAENRKITVRVNYSFRAKLALSTDEVKGQYIELKNEIACYKKVKTSISRKQERVYKGRNNLAYMLFRGKKLCIALALDPNEYAETKYRGKDVSGVKRFEKTPMLLKLTSARKVKYAKYLIEQLMLKNEIEKGEPAEVITEVESATREELIERGEIVISGVVTENEQFFAQREEQPEEAPVEEVVEQPVEEVAEEVPEEPVEEVVEEILVEETVEEEPAEEISEEVYEETAAAAAEEVFEAEPVEEIAEEEEPEEEEEDEEPLTEEEEELAATQELDVSEMSEATREALGITEEDAAQNKKITVRVNYSFRAKLALSTDEVKGQYIELKNEIACYKKVKTSISRKQERVYKGRNNLAYMLFRGKKLCIALALDPNEYAETKYRGKDVSGVKRFEKTPMLLKLTSARKVKYAKYLIEQLMLKNEIEKGEPAEVITEVESATREELIERGEIVISGVVTENEQFFAQREEQPEEAPVEEVVEQPVEEVAEEEAPVEEVAEEVSEEPVEEVTEEVPEEPVEEVVEEIPVEETVEEVAEEEAPVEEVTEEVFEEPVEEVVEEIPVEETVEEVAEEEAPVEEVTEEVSEEVYEETAAAVAEEVFEEEPVEEVTEEEEPEEVIEEIAEEEEPEELPEEEEIPEEEPLPEPEPEPEPEPDDVLVEREFEIQEEVDVQQAETFSDEDAKQLVEEKVIKVKKSTGKKKGIVNIDSLSRNYDAGAHVTVDNLREKGLIPKDVTVIKVLAKGTINKPLIVEADDFSLGAVKMIVLTGGRAIRRKIVE